MEQINRAKNTNNNGNLDPTAPSMDSLHSEATIAPKKPPNAVSNGSVYPVYNYQTPQETTTLGHHQQYMMSQYPQPRQYQQEEQGQAPQQPPQPPHQIQSQPQPQPQPQQQQQHQQQHQQNQEPNHWKPGQPQQNNNAGGGWLGASTEYAVPPTAPQQSQHGQHQHHFFPNLHAYAHGLHNAYSQPNLHTQYAPPHGGGTAMVGGPPQPPPPTIPENTEPRLQDGKGSGRPHTLMSCLRDGLRNITIIELAPLSTLATAAFLHHYRHRHSNDFIPYKPPKWVKYIKNSLYAYSTYRFLLNNGIIKKDAIKQFIPTGGGGGTRDIQGGGEYPPEKYERSRSLDVDDAAGSSFATMGGGVQAPSVFVFDPRHAIPKAYAKDYYRYVYDDAADLRQTPAYVLGGAAAIRALRNEAHVLSMLASEPQMTSDLDVEQMAMGMAIAEAEECIARKRQQVRRLANDDTIEYVGRISLATMGKIREDKRLSMSSKGAAQYLSYNSKAQEQQQYPYSSKAQGQQQQWPAHGYRSDSTSFY
ncbi:hypothetical protein LPJ74_002338 [Coemansia sp. RSA 1843]|nr:hypothetical protein LPJ74_002338 [Coemansia sp. RSA 1843]